MTHTGPMPDSAGDFGPPTPVDEPCRSCGARQVSQWDSHCGGWTDDQYRCGACGATWWVDGIDS